MALTASNKAVCRVSRTAAAAAPRCAGRRPFTPTRAYQAETSAAAAPAAAAGVAQPQAMGPRPLRRGVEVSEAAPVTAEELFRLTTSNMGELGHGSPVSGYSGRWWRWEGATTTHELDAGRDVYAFRWKPDTLQGETAQVWLALTSKRDASPFVGPRLHSDPIQAELDIETNIMELSPATPMFQPSIAGQLPDLGAALRTWAVDGYGFCTAPAGLPKLLVEAGAGDEGAAAAAAPGGPWVATPLLRLPGPAGERWSVKLKYCPRTGALLDTRHSWEAALGPLPDMRAAFAPHGGPAASRESPPCVDAWFASASPRPALRRATEFSYSPDGSQLLRAAAAAAAGGAEGGGDEWWWAAPAEGGAGTEAQVAEIWYPNSGAYARAPLSLAPLVAAGADAVMEAGVVMPDGSLARWVLRYATTGDRRLKAATHQVFSPAA